MYTGPIEIEITVGELPDVLRREDKFGLELQGWHPKEGLRDEPEDGDEGVLTVRWQIDKSLEPTWTVVNKRQKEPRTIGPRDREAFGVVRLGGEVERHLSWAREVLRRAGRLTAMRSWARCLRKLTGRHA